MLPKKLFSGWSNGFELAEDNIISNARILEFSDLWRGTPYASGQRVRGVGVDCSNLVTAFLDNISHMMSDTPIPPLMDKQFEGDKPGWGVLRAINSVHPLEYVEDSRVCPGDILVCGDDRGDTESFGHAMIALPVTGLLLHAVPESGTCITSIDAVPIVHKIIRAKEKQSWVS